MRGDHLTLDAYCEALLELSIDSDSGIAGYRDGFNAEGVADWSQTERGFNYRKGYGKGLQARARGAHGEAEVAS